MDEDVSVTFSSSRSMTVKHVIPFGRRVAYSCGHVLNDLCASMWFSYLLMFEHTVLQLSNAVAGNLMLLGQVADALATPFVGYESDQPNDMFLCRYGRRKAWHLVGTICVVCTFPFLFMECIICSNSSQYAKFIYYGAFIVIFQFGWAAVQVSHLSLIPDLTPLSCERVELNSYRYAMTVMSNICTYSTLLVILGVASGEDKHIGPSDLTVFRNVALAMVGVGIFFSLMFHVFVKETEHPHFAFQEQCIINEASDMIEKPHLTWRDWFAQPQFYMVALLYTSTRIFINISQVYMPMYIQDTLGLHKNKIAIIPLVIYVSGFLASFIVKFLNRYLGSKITYFLGCILGLGSCIWMYLGKGEYYSTYEIYGLAVIIGIAGTTLLIISLGITSDLIANSTTSGAFVFGCMSFLDKLTNGVAVVIIQDFHPCFTCCADCRWYYKYVLVFTCGGAVLIGLLALSCLSTQSIGERRNEEQLHRNSIIRNNRRITARINAAKNEEEKSLLGEDSDSLAT